MSSYMALFVLERGLFCPEPGPFCQVHFVQGQCSRRNLLNRKQCSTRWTTSSRSRASNALEDSDKTSSHGWSTANRFGIDIQQGSPQVHQQQFKPQQQQHQKQYQQPPRQQSPRQQSPRQQPQQRSQQVQQQQWSRQSGDHNIYNHLINQNNRGDVPDALMEEEIPFSETFSTGSTSQHQTSAESKIVNTSQTKAVHQVDARNQPVMTNPQTQPGMASPRVQSPMVFVSLTQPGNQQGTRGITRSEVIQRQNREVQMKNFQQQSQFIQNSQGNQSQSIQVQTVSQSQQYLTGDLRGGQYQQHVVQVQQGPPQVQQGPPQVQQGPPPQLQQHQSTQIQENPQELDKELALNEKQIEENNRKLRLFQQMGIVSNVSQFQQVPQNVDLQQLQTAGINQVAQAQNFKLVNYNMNKGQTPVQQQRRQSFVSDGSGLVGVDYVGSVRLPNTGISPQQNSNVRTILFNSQNTGKVDVKFLENTGAPNRPVNEVKPQVITLSHNKPKACVQTSQGQANLQSNNFQKSASPNIQTTRGSNPSTNNMSQNVSANQTWTKGTQSNDSLSGCTVIEGARVELKGGGKFEEGQIYVVKNKSGQEKKMIWTGKELVEMKQDVTQALIQSSPPSQTRGRGRGQGQGRGRGRGRGQLQGNATGVHMSQQGGGQSPMMNNTSIRSPVFGGQTTTPEGAAVKTPSHMISTGQGTSVRTPSHVIRPVRAQAPILRHQSPQPRAQGQQQQKIQVIQPTASVRMTGPAPVIRQPMIINTSNLMPPAQGSQKLATGSTTNLARKAVESKTVIGDNTQKQTEDQQVDQDEQTDRQGGGDAKSENKQGEETRDSLPPHVVNNSNLVAVCQFCGQSSQNKLKCERCGRKFNSSTKYYYKSDPEAKRRKIEVNTQTSTSQDSAVKKENTLTKRSFYGQKLAEQNQIYATMLSLNGPGVTIRGLKRVRGSGGAAEGRGRGRGHQRGHSRMRGIHVPETVTISSDEEEDAGSESSSKPATPKPQPTSEAAPSTPSQNSNNSIEPLESPIIPTIPISSKVDNKPRVDKMEDEKGISKKGQREKSPSPEKLTVLLQARTVRVGTFRGAPIEPIQLSDEGIEFYIEGMNVAHRFQLYPREITQCLARFGKGTCLLFFLPSQSAGQRVRNDFGMPTHLDPTVPPPEPYFDPASPEMCHQMITVLLDSVDNKTVYEFGRVMEIFRKFGHVMDSSFYLELNDEEADEVLKQASKIIPSQQNNVVADHQYTFMDDDRHSPSPPKMGFVGPIIKLLTYPPPPATGGISITNEDLYCLQEGEFLNDVIIDFYLKYLLLEKLSEEDKKRTHIFSSFFWKRLTQRVRALDDDTTQSLPVKRHARVKTWTRHVDLFKKDFVIVPINEHAHWFLAIICYPGLEDVCENPFIPKPHTSPPPPESAIPTPPQPRDDEEDMDMEEMESENPFLEEGQTATNSEGETKQEDAKEPKEPSDNSSDTNKVKPSEEIKGHPKSKTKSEKGKQSSEKSDTSSDEANTQESAGTENSEMTESEDTSQSTDTDRQTEEMDTSEKTENGGKSTPTPARVSPASVQALTEKAEAIGKALAGDRIIRGQPVSEETIKTEELKKGTGYQIGMKQPCVIVFDSLLGPSRSRVVQVLKEYLMVEWSIKRGGTEYRKQLIKGTVPKVPQQTNYSDCGVFMLQYVESFFEDPIQDYVTPMKGLYDWFSLEKIEGKREELRDLIIGLKDKFENKTEAKENS